jgi:glycosyltransferase involved in cell wall biosynthesis
MMLNPKAQGTVTGPKVMMLMWEIPPLVAGGTWTACYHLVRKLRRQGADVTVVVPWTRSAILDTAFGDDVPVAALGIVPPALAGSAYAGGSLAWSSYGQPPQTLWSSYGAALSSYGAYAGGRAARDVMFRLIRVFRQRLERFLASHPADVIHAHDWVTFDAAKGASARYGIPWIAHVHSIEADRRPDGPDMAIERMERAGLAAADRILTPSAVTRHAVIDRYAADPGRIEVLPNMLADVDPASARSGRFDPKRVIFLGRLSRQKGVDRFGAVADIVRQVRPDASFEAYGDGEERVVLSRHGVQSWGAIGWAERGTAFADASVLLVPSRAEPFGMVVLEAMEHGVPVIYPDHSGAAEALESGIKVRADDLGAMADAVTDLLDHRDTWAAMAAKQAREIQAYPERGHDQLLMGAWQGMTRRAA